uniref:Polyketide cyclase/dehydrase n=1 Tax=bacterium enrichment culture TaxID=207831 RepID=A0A0R7N6K0_9BACT|nr:polyketide cyclase/dehydrase [bacterium enrichment culture]
MAFPRPRHPVVDAGVLHRDDRRGDRAHPARLTTPAQELPLQIRTLVAFAFVIRAAVAGAEVVESGASGFVVREEATVSAPPAQAWAAFVDVASWWNPAHSYSSDAANLSLDAKAGGCFCEKLAGGGSVEHLRVVMVMPGKVLRMAGGLGPLQSSPVAGSMTVAFAAVPNGTKVSLTYGVGGFMPGGVDKMAGPVDGVLAEQIARYRLFVETGKPVAAGK